MQAQEGWKRKAQLFSGHPTTTQPSAVHCTPFTLPSDGFFEISPGTTVTLTANAVFTPQCTTAEILAVDDGSGGVTSIADMQDPFHASITPQAYATGAATVIAWMLVIMLIITPRTFFVGGASGKSGLMGRRGLIGGASGGGSIIGVGTRPWLQKVAALTVAVSLTLATADTFKIAEQQYADGFMDASKLRDQVVSGMEIKVSRVISDVFLWLAQVQTLIRLFPRHKEKVIIKWVGFALILLDITFSCLNSFGPYNDRGRPRHFETAIPALSYLFQLSLSMLYAAWVMYYGITKRRYAFYHSMMWNIAVVALLSFIAVLTPVVFFITDISNYTIAGWGDYFRWVGAAAASVIVWEWVERIEALEREERKDGILGREIYDGDEMLDTTPSHEVWPQRQSYMSNDPKKPKDDGGGRGGAVASGHTSNAFSNLAHRLGRPRKEQPKTEPKNKRTIHIPAPPLAHRRSDSTQRGERKSRSYLPLQSPTTPPPITATPVSRTDTASADSTVYTVRYHPVSDTPPINTLPVPFEERLRAGTPNAEAADLQAQRANVDPEKGMEMTEDANMTSGKGRWHWQAVANPFRRRGRSPPPEIQRGRVIEPLAIDDVSANIPPRNYAGLALKDRLGTFAAQQGEKFRTKRNDGRSPERSLPVTIIPAQPRGRTWSPELLNLQQQEEVTYAAGIRITRNSPRSVPDISDGNAPSASQLDTAPEASGFSSSRNSHVRFTPETFQHPAARKQDDADSRAPSQHQSSLGLGTEMRDPFSEFTFTPQSPGALPSPVSRQSLDGHHTPTNHNR